MSDLVAGCNAGGCPGTLEAVGRGYVRFALANPERFEVMFRLDLVNRYDPHFVAASEG